MTAILFPGSSVKSLHILFGSPGCTAKKVSSKCPNASCYIPYLKKKNVKLITQYIGPKFRTPSLQNRQKFEEKFKYLKGEMELGENRIIYCQ